MNENRMPNMDAPLYDYAGAIHIHSNLSDGTGAVPMIIEQAQQAELDFIILTDHEHLEARELGYEGWRGNTLCLVGEEITPRFHNHYLAFNIRQPIRGRGNWRRPQTFIDETRRQGGIGFIAHPIGDDYPVRGMAKPWLDWEVDGFTGIELWSYMHDWARNLRWKNIARALRDPDSLLRGPHPKALKRWDEIGKRRRVAAIGTLDIHAKRAPGLPCAKILPYRHAFRTIRTHVLTEYPLAQNDPNEAGRQVYEALAHGRAYIAHDGFGDGAGFQFFAAKGGRTTALMGGETAMSAGLELYVKAPEKCSVTLLRDGEPIAQTNGKTLEAPAEKPGVYRIEARKEGRPWIYSNAVYVRG